MDSDFGPPGKLVFETGELTEHSIVILKKKMEALSKLFHELVEVDMTSPFKHKVSYGLMTALRPWVFSMISLEKNKKNAS